MRFEQTEQEFPFRTFRFYLFRCSFAPGHFLTVERPEKSCTIYFPTGISGKFLQMVNDLCQNFSAKKQEKIWNCSSSTRPLFLKKKKPKPSHVPIGPIIRRRLPWRFFGCSSRSLQWASKVSRHSPFFGIPSFKIPLTHYNIPPSPPKQCWIC